MSKKSLLALFVSMCLVLAGCGKSDNKLVSSQEFIRRYNASLDIIGDHMKKNYSQYSISGVKTQSENGGAFMTTDAISIGWVPSKNDEKMDAVIMVVMPGSPSAVLANALFMAAIDQEKNKVDADKTIDALLSDASKGKRASEIENSGYVFGYMMDNSGVVFSIYTKEYHEKVITGTHMGAASTPMNQAIPRSSTTNSQSSQNQPQAPALQPSNSPKSQPKQNEQPPTPRMKKEISGTEAINGFWNGDPTYPVISVSGNMTKIADKSSVKFSKSEQEELISMDVYGFTKEQGQCWQETFTFRRKGRTSNYYSSNADSQMLMEFVKDSAVHEAYRIACETAGVPLEMAPSR